ncbi:PTS glucitol/sorbitol transporter subunit IIC [Calorimonas adulescens]|jgi:PTS system, glucitol/sorbitol-specific, IIC component|uniref:PTS sorbitol transporter subunit IIC n=1 Tax=Calorimonas adulescens TaxID=2606906 RepID=A0A5D8QCG2_9THEO|nr:PTS glucitol/sorbitol transporter subunit IIC [Calorimonas adulescens]MDI6601231.1 PTS glucitol/sorbitol transporter subunit IIC [Thermoanaerobacteraceae bacterium]TZE81486.1 PTS sorbitol transporter subunit IIC [Calorimonas adulescens]
MDVLANFAQGFIGVFQEGGKTFVGFLSGIVPTLVTLMTAVNALVKFVGEERVNRWGEAAGRYTILRYTVMPIMAMFFLTNPMAYTFGRFLPEKYKPAFYDAAVSFCHPITGLFPHANPAELFVYMGIAQGIQQLGLSIGGLAVRYFIVGIIVIFIRGVVTERLTLRMMRQQGIEI